MTQEAKATAQDLDRLRKFNTKVNKLRRSSFAREMFTKSTGVTISWKKGEGPPRAAIRGPGEESLDAMILTLRLLIQNNDAYSLGQMAKIYERLPTASLHRTRFLEGRATINEYLDRETELSIVHQGEKLTNRRVLELIIYGERAHENEEKAAVVRSLRRSPIVSVLLDNEFNDVAARGIAGIFYLQAENADLYEELTGEKLAVDWPTPPENVTA